MTRSLSKKLSEEPFKVPYPVTPTNSVPADEVCNIVCVNLNFSLIFFISKLYIEFFCSARKSQTYIYCWTILGVIFFIIMLRPVTLPR